MDSEDYRSAVSKFFYSRRLGTLTELFVISLLTITQDSEISCSTYMFKETFLRRMLDPDVFCVETGRILVIYYEGWYVTRLKIRTLYEGR